MSEDGREAMRIDGGSRWPSYLAVGAVCALAATWITLILI